MAAIAPTSGPDPQSLYARLHQLATSLQPQVQTSSYARSAEASRSGPGYASTVGMSVQADRTVISDQASRLAAGQLAAQAQAGVVASDQGHVALGTTSSLDGAAMLSASAVAGLNAQGVTASAPGLQAGQAQLLAQAAAQIRAAAVGQATLGQDLAVQGGAAVEAEAAARVSAQGAYIASPQLVGAQLNMLAEAAARVRATASGQAQLAQAINVGARATVEGEAVARAQASGQVSATPTHFVAEGQAVAEALARARGEVAGHVDAGPALAANAAVNAEVAAGHQTSAAGMVHLGTDQFGLPDFGIGASVGTASGAWAKTGASGDASILGLIRIGVSGSLQAIAGLAGGLGGQIHYHDGAITVGAGGSAAAGVGGGGDASVTIGLGKLPGGVLQAVGAPILPLPGLIVTSIVRGFHSLTGSKDPDPTAGKPGIEDFPKVVASNFTNGVSLIGQGAVDAANQVATVGTAIGKGVADGAVFVAKNVAKGAVVVANGVADGAGAVAKGVASVGTTIGKGVADGATAVWHGLTHLFD